MLKLFFAILLFLLSLTMAAYDKELKAYTDSSTINLKTGLRLQQPAIPVYDFTRRYPLPAMPLYRSQLYMQGEAISGASLADTWYHIDFSEDPFDGRIDIIIGEPLPSAKATFFIVLVVAGIIIWSHNKLQLSATA